MKKLIQPLTALLYSLVAVLLGIGVYVMIAFSWFTNTELVEPDLSGFSVSAYFGGGNGSPDDPFLIKNNRHLYNLCWLQYLGYFNKQGALDEHGRIVTQGHENEMTQFSFSIETNLNMSGWYLPPLGTTLNPFVGLLNGQGHTISGLQTTNTFSEFGNKHPSSVNASNFANVEIIGFAGVIGKYDSMRLNSLSIDPDANAIANIKLSGTQVRTKDSTLAGIAAGYINGTVEDVGIVGGEIYFNANSSVFGSMEDISAYTVAGYATDGYVTRTSTTKATVLNPTNTVKTNYVYENPGDSDSWGGSIDMLSLYRRIGSQTRTILNDYISDEIHYYNQDGTKYQNSVIINSTPIATNKSTDTAIRNYYYNSYSGGTGNYLTLGAPNNNNNGYDYLTGLYKTVINIEVKSTTTGYKIKAPNINNYLGVSSTRQGNTTNFNVTLLTNGTTNADTATEWIQSSKNGGGNHLYTYNKDDGYQYYLNATPTSLTISDTGTTTWQYDANYGYYITQNNVNYYLRYINNQWMMSEKLSYLITDNNNYLSRNGTNVTNGTDYTQATRWIFENENGVNGSYGAIYDESDTSYKLIINNNNLACSTTNNPTSWSNNGNNLYNDNKFIAYYNNAWRLYINNAKYIKYSNYYLTLNANGTINNTETDQDNASSWTFSNNDTNPKGYLTTTIGETTYYLSFNNSNTNKLEIVTNQTQAIQWANDGDGAYYTYNNVKYYLQYKNSIWQAAQAATKTIGFYVKSGNNYLSQDYTFNFDDSDRLYFDNNGTRTYVVITRSGFFRYTYDWGISTSSDYALTLYTYNNYKYLRTNYDGTNVYLIYNNDWTVSTSNRPNNGRLTFEDIIGDDIENTPRPSIITNTNNVPYICDLRASNPNMTRTSVTTNVYYRNPDKEMPSLFNYIPLNTNNDNTVKTTNTGYIMSGGHSGPSGSIDLSTVDIRVAGYASAYSINSRLVKSVNDDGTIKTQNGQDLVYTYNSNGLKQLYQSGITYEKYTASRKNMEDTLKDASSNNGGRVGGIHFITSLISLDHMIVAPKVLINGQPYDNYEMPENSIDFRLKTKGYINFFASLFYPGNSTFFSLNQIIRNDDEYKTIKEINHITEIYQNPSNKSLPYIYKYANQTSEGYWYSNSSNTLPSGYQCIFYTSWIETPQLENWDKSNYMTKLYYFEIPVNEGEYALGSVNGRDGGYLLYLDIGANAQQINRTEITQKSVVSQYDYVYPNGIAIIEENTTIDDAINNNSLDASKSSSFKVSSASAQQSIIATRTSNTAINFATGITNGAVVYKPRTVTVTKNDSAVQAAAVRTTTSIYSQIQYIDHNVTLGDIYETNIQQINSDPITYEIYKIGVQGTTEGFTRTLIDQSATSPEWRLYAINTVGGTVKNVLVDLTSASDTNATAIKTQLTNIANTAVTTTNTCLDYEYDTVTGATNTYAIHINMTLDNNELYYYKFTGDDVTVTTDNVGGTIIYVNVSNTTYTFRLLNNDHTANLVVGTNVTLPLQ